MTMTDFLVVGGGTLALLIIFLTAGAIYTHGTLDLWGVLRRYVAVRIVDNMSSEAQNDPVPGMVSGAVPLPSIRITPIDIVALAGSLTEAQYIELGARLQDHRGKFVFSGRNLYKLAGGNHDEFLANMRRWRGEEIEEQPHFTPYVGRRTDARFETDADYPYQPIKN